ncbi:MAG: sigma-70 family RNA polymerase sigma factor [Dysgonamonadaceae bacterium]|jgi:RNA polymerase sigma-70 factor (ECF subfamily)|nr:sigma-70 family RNA polymerase sigma factor [Dysgonamonadaceae bacterium]
MKNVSDHFYIQRVKAGDVQAFSGIVQKYQSMVLTVVMKIVENREDAEDITQEVFIKVFKSLEQFKEESEFSTWLYRIAYNTTLSELRKRKICFTTIEDHLPLAEEAINEDVEACETEEKLRYLDQALHTLPPDEIFLITLYYREKQSVDDISKISALSVSNVKVKLHRIRKKLALEMNKLMQDEKR